MRVLIACEESQTVCKAFRELDHEAYSCDIQDCSGGHPEWHLKMDVFEAIVSRRWDLMIAHPPCTYLATSANKWYKTENLHYDPDKPEKREQAVRFFMAIANAEIPKIAIENPKCIMVSRWRKADQITQPFHFGDPVPKGIYLWLKNLKPLIHTNVVEPEYVYYNSKRTKSGKSRYSIAGKLGSGKSKERSKFFPGIAKAMAEQWGALLILLMPFFSIAQQYCMPITEARIIISEAARAQVMDTLVGKYEQRIELDSFRIAHLSSQYSDEIRLQEKITESVRKQFADERKINDSLREEVKSLRKKEKFWPRLWRTVKIGGAISVAGFVGYEIGDKL